MSDHFTLAARVIDFACARVLCVGDAMLDRFVYGEVARISPEAPIPVLRIAREVAMPGGAANVVRNLAALGAAVDFIAVTGADEAGAEIGRLLAGHANVAAQLATEPERRTTIKTRFIAQAQQLLRTDEESDAPVNEATEARLGLAAEAALERAGVMILSDYGKGVITDALLRRLIAAANRLGVPSIVDPKGPDFARYRGASVITPNRRELAEASRMKAGSLAEIEAAARRVMAECGIATMLITLSAEGMLLVSGHAAEHLPAEAREVFDVSGAGDTVVATLAAGLAAGLDVGDAARIANVAAGIVVGKAGTAVAFADEIVGALHKSDFLTGEHKTVALAPALDRVAAWRARRERIGFTNGVFDLIHPGHVSLLAQARAACERLVVGINSDASVKRLKGPTRPIQSEAARAAVLGSLATVDLVVIFAEDTPLKLIEAIKPDVLVKGADYRVDQVVGADIVQSYGGKVVLAELAPGHSTTATIARLNRR